PEGLARSKYAPRLLAVLARSGLQNTPLKTTLVPPSRDGLRLPSDGESSRAHAARIPIPSSGSSPTSTKVAQVGATAVPAPASSLVLAHATEISGIRAKAEARTGEHRTRFPPFIVSGAH